MRAPTATLFAVVLLACTSPTAPPPTGPSATVSGTVVERVDGAPYSLLRCAGHPLQPARGRVGCDSGALSV